MATEKPAEPIRIEELPRDEAEPIALETAEAVTGGTTATTQDVSSTGDWRCHIHPN